MRVAQVAAEVAPWCATGGLGQVMAALPDAIAATGDATVDSFFPLCRRAAGADLELTEVAADLGEGARLLALEGDHQAAIYFIDAPRYFDRPTLYGPYDDPYPDDAARFLFFLDAVQKAWEATGMPDVSHSHDWHSAPLAALVEGPATVVTIHNLAYQGVFPAEAVPAGRLASDGRVNFLGIGISAADVVTTVSPTYAEEILTAGTGLEEVLAARAEPVGILNGIDTGEWDPGSNRFLPAPFTADDLTGKEDARRALAQEMGLDIDEGDLVVAVVSRLVQQKGIDVMIEVATNASELGVRLAVVGDGDPALEAALRGAAARQPGRVAVHIGWDQALAHLVIGGSDVIAIPSRFEPCGLTQMQAMRYGTIPVAHAVGGLADTVVDPGDAALARGEGSGFTFDSLTPTAVAAALRRAAALRTTDGWELLQRRVMEIDWSWQRAAAEYVDLYRSL